MAKNKSIFQSVLYEAHHFLVGAAIVIVALVIVPAFAQETTGTTTPAEVPAVTTPETTPAATAPTGTTSAAEIKPVEAQPQPETAKAPEPVPLEPQVPVVIPAAKTPPALPELPTLDLDSTDETALIGALGTYRDWVKRFRETKVPKSRIGFKSAKTHARQFLKSTIKVCDFEEERSASRACKKMVRGAFKASNKAKNKGQLDAILDRVVQQYLKFFEVNENSFN